MTEILDQLARLESACKAVKALSEDNCVEKNDSNFSPSSSDESLDHISVRELQERIDQIQQQEVAQYEPPQESARVQFEVMEEPHFLIYDDLLVPQHRDAQTLLAY